jgi:hypothetical protein
MHVHPIHTIQGSTTSLPHTNVDKHEFDRRNQATVYAGRIMLADSWRLKIGDYARKLC